MTLTGMQIYANQSVLNFPWYQYPVYYMGDLLPPNFYSYLHSPIFQFLFKYICTCIEYIQEFEEIQIFISRTAEGCLKGYSAYT